MRGLRGKRTLITGGASGIGRATVARLLDEGARVAVLDRNAEGCRALTDEEPRVELVSVGDVSRVEDVRRAFEALDERWGGLDGLVNNAGMSIRHAFLEITPEEWQEVLATNLTGSFHVAQAAARRMVDAGNGVIVNMGSMNGLIGCPNYADYNAAKAGVVELTRTMALELAPHVRVLGVCPGAVLTPMQEAEYTDEMMAGLNGKIPLQRHARPEEVAALFAFLLSDEAPFMTGHSIVIDGGESAGGLASHAADQL